jgi:hypothetical protein
MRHGLPLSWNLALQVRILSLGKCCFPEGNRDKERRLGALQSCNVKIQREQVCRGCELPERSHRHQQVAPLCLQQSRLYLQYAWLLQRSQDLLLDRSKFISRRGQPSLQQTLGLRSF